MNTLFLAISVEGAWKLKCFSGHRYNIGNRIQARDQDISCSFVVHGLNNEEVLVFSIFHFFLQHQSLLKIILRQESEKVLSICQYFHLAD